MVILHSMFVSVPSYNFPCFYCCGSISKVWRKERLKKGKKNGAKNGVKTVQKMVRKIITVQRTFKNSAITLSCKRVSTSVPIGQMVFSDYIKRRILLLRERGKCTKEISELLLKEDIRASHRGISKFLSRYNS